jgi:hypothetical protein
LYESKIDYVDEEDEINDSVSTTKNNLNDEIKDVDATINDRLFDNKSNKARKISIISQASGQSINLNENSNNNNKSNLMLNIFTLNPTAGSLSSSNVSNITAINQQNEPQLLQYGVETSNFGELHGVMQKINSWGIDIFLIDELTMHRPLTAVTYTVFQVSFIF